MSSSPMSRRTSLMPTSLPNNAASTSDDSALPIRHPRPMTAAELHHELEKEQEAVVNRLQRELSQLRAQTASVVSNASSTSSSHPAVFDDAAVPTEVPTSARRRRASSSVSSRSLTSHTAGLGERTSQASVDRARDAGMTTPAGSSRSRQNSHSTTLPAPVMARSVNSPAPPRASLSRQSSERGMPPPMHYFGGSSGQVAQSPGGRPDEAAQAKAALEVARRENDRLVGRVRELEAALKEKQKSKTVV